jgi:cellulose synthase/poly-beta-1,6-N-acetylglucosamine synthase-like glycosyltransferase
LQAWRHADEGYDVVANIDADVVPHATWLRELVAALGRAEVVVATGNRWYMPDEPSPGALVRYFWNAAAIVPMYWYAIAWGGTLAFKADLLRTTDYRRRVAQALCEDTMLADLLRGTGRRIAFVPSLMMVNRESCTLNEFYSWMRRQLLVAKLYHSRFALVTGHGLVVGAWLIVAAFGLFQAAAAGDAASSRIILTTMGVFFASMFCILPLIEAGVRRIVRRRGEPTDWLTLPKLAALFALGPVTLALYVAGIVSLLRPQQIRWRGIRYRIDGPFRIQRLDDGVYCPSPEAAAGAAQSL